MLRRIVRRREQRPARWSPSSELERLNRAAELIEDHVSAMLTYYGLPEQHWRRLRTHNPLERILREIRRPTRVVGAFPDGPSGLKLAAVGLRHIARALADPTLPGHEPLYHEDLQA